MPQRTVRFRIRQDGVVEESVEGVIGQSCNQLTERLEAALGSVEHRELKPEAYLQEEVQSQSIPLEII
ncbi:DUF2997 domain-containing protein [Prochlorococcus marinus]|uniref:DUF2997 domain-containing protein n=1 Tax=Prochlorococcus marinus (strain MIT 9211) TaxID=93059 RepID=A9BCG8_PROM4|nr:DUF2997 domain-containing protein [Prochlorococcus marinus]ABX09530.1 conserved hypothetical protein [Prochlorococcus marinus str. MIT 9211]